MYFPFLNEEPFRTPESSKSQGRKKHATFAIFGVGSHVFGVISEMLGRS